MGGFVPGDGRGLVAKTAVCASDDTLSCVAVWDCGPKLAGSNSPNTAARAAMVIDTDLLQRLNPF